MCLLTAEEWIHERCRQNEPGHGLDTKTRTRKSREHQNITEVDDRRQCARVTRCSPGVRCRGQRDQQLPSCIPCRRACTHATLSRYSPHTLLRTKFISIRILIGGQLRSRPQDCAVASLPSCSCLWRSLAIGSTLKAAASIRDGQPEPQSQYCIYTSRLY